MSAQSHADRLHQDLRRLQARLTEIDTLGAQLVEEHRQAIAQRQATVGAIQYIESLLAPPKK